MGRRIALNDQGRRIGETHHRATVSDDTIREIRDLHEYHGWGCRRIGRELGLHWTYVAKVCRYEIRAQLPMDWRTVEEPPPPQPTGGAVQYYIPDTFRLDGWL